MYAHWYSFFITLKRWHCYALTGLSLLVCFGLWLLCCYLPLQRKLMHVTMQLQQARKDIVLCIRERECNKQSMQDIESLQKDYQVCLCDQSTAHRQLLHDLLSKASVCNVQIISLKKGVTQKKEGHCICLLHMQAQGTLQGIQAFFEQLTVDNRLLIQCCEFDIQRGAHDQYTLQAVLKQFVAQKTVEKESPSTLEKLKG